MPTVTLVTDVFAPLARSEAATLGMKELSLVVVPHPMGGLPAPEVRAKAEAALEGILAGLLKPVAVRARA